MIYAFSVLFFILGLSTGIPAYLQWRRMEAIRRSSETTFGVIRSVGRSSGWNFWEKLAGLPARWWHSAPAIRNMKWK